MEKIEVPIIKNPSKSLPNLQDLALERRKQIKDSIIKKVGFKNARGMTSEIAEKFKVSERTIRNDFDWIKGNWQPIDKKEVEIDLKIARDKSLEAALDLLATAQSRSAKEKSIKLLAEINKAYREEMEAWGEKPKVAEKHEIMGKLLQLEFVTHDGNKESNSGTKPKATESVGIAE